MNRLRVLLLETQAFCSTTTNTFCFVVQLKPIKMSKLSFYQRFVTMQPSSSLPQIALGDFPTLDFCYKLLFWINMYVCYPLT